jgi:glycosyltransferase involved in cell wall biosynthesis
MQLLSLYKTYVDSKVRLVLVGGGFSSEYSESLLNFAKQLDLKVGFKTDDEVDLIFTKDLSEDELANVYHQSSVFICMSEHEGFCVPLVEAMCAGLPILAHRAAVIPETLGDAGVLVDKRNWEDVLRQLQRILTDDDFRKTLIEKGRERAKDFDLQRNTGLLKTFLCFASKMLLMSA